MRPPPRLRWQLTISHLIAIAFTLVSMVAAVVLIAGGRLATQVSGWNEPAQVARQIASSIGGLVARADSAAELNAILPAIARGDLRAPAWAAQFGPESGRWSERLGPSFEGLAYIIVFDASGSLVASSQPAGAAFSPPEAPEWLPLVQAALAGEANASRLVAIRSGGAPAALGAAPAADEQGRLVGAVLVGTSRLPGPPSPVGLWRSLAFFSAASVAVLAASSVFALVSATLVGYLLSRRLVSRLERLGQAAESMAAGDLAQRVEEGPPDEVGQLARRFNAMAGTLAATVSELESARRAADAALDTKRALVANVSHELRTPLALLRGHVESLLMQGAGDDRQRAAYLAVVQRETEQLNRLIDDLFALSTAEAGALPLTIEPVAVDGVVQEVVDGSRPIAWQERQITVASELAPGLPPALADRQRVVQVLGNLVRNALRHTPEGGLIAVRAEAQDGCLAIAVEDTGDGIPPDQLAHVFERFYRGDDARDRASGGAGLGLAIVRELVEAMGGTVTAESVLGQGSRFTFRLPVAATPAEPA